MTTCSTATSNNVLFLFVHWPWPWPLTYIGLFLPISCQYVYYYHAMNYNTTEQLYISWYWCVNDDVIFHCMLHIFDRYVIRDNRSYPMHNSSEIIATTKYVLLPSLIQSTPKFGNSSFRFTTQGRFVVFKQSACTIWPRYMSGE
jgi:hypothetical protein